MSDCACVEFLDPDHRNPSANTLCDKAAPACAVMLHLRDCYVSKARDFNGPGTSCAGRKSKSRLNSKGLDR